MTSVADRTATARGLVLVDTSTRPDPRRPFDGADVETYASHQLAARVRDARKDGRPFVGVVGDDRDVHIAAEELAHGDTALLPLASLESPVPDAHRTVDLGRVNGRCFLHHSRVGLDLRPTPLIATLRQLLAGPRLILRIDGRPTAAWSIFVGNGCFGPGVDEQARRESVDEHVLDVRIVRAGGRGARLRMLATMLRGGALSTRVVERRTCTGITVEVRGRQPVDVALDGESEHFATPLRYESDANALRVLVPEN